MAEKDEQKLDETKTDADAVEQSEETAVAESADTDETASDAAGTKEAAEGAENDAESESDDDDESGKGDDDKDDEEENEEDVYGLSMDKVEAVLSKSADESAMTPQMRKMFARQQESTKRVEESIKGTKSNPSWFVPVFCALLIIGLIWVVVYYMTGKYPIPGIDAWNLAIGFAIMLVGFLMTMGWH
ncbi:cell division protein CrgA [Bifidobacterium sp. SMB2]|uniref:Cell division protein CrgA n=1 Tax=Bifidobacterium saimiriisciurei TaxID=2661627 RepID=A0ABX0CDZ1_9BIFI|nr:MULTISPECIES: cell division protein CrgA [Bifidobacterium]NEG95570.1 cell division protein CrgA [Bifidobacterium sp. SMB2]NEH12484.1 cell division protein CrgA [Bifidobacterium saimiriisciurei]